MTIYDVRLENEIVKVKVSTCSGRCAPSAKRESPCAGQPPSGIRPQVSPAIDNMTTPLKWLAKYLIYSVDNMTTSTRTKPLHLHSRLLMSSPRTQLINAAFTSENMTW